jgi:hypothetical protein
MMVLRSSGRSRERRPSPYASVTFSVSAFGLLYRRESGNYLNVPAIDRRCTCLGPDWCNFRVGSDTYIGYIFDED